jgi:hypothetical protein
MNTHIAIDPDLNVDPQAFVAAWNATPETRAVAEAEVAPRPPQGFPLDPALVLSIFARDWSTGFRPKWSTPTDDAGETPSDNKSDDRWDQGSIATSFGEPMARWALKLAPVMTTRWAA